MVLALTTVARVKARAGGTWSSSNDAELTALIDELSAAAAQHLRRHTQSAARVETITLRRARSVLTLQGYPISSVTAVRLASHSSEMATNADLDASEWDIESADAGLLRLATTLPTNPTLVRVSYTGGMAADTTAFIAGYPDIAGAIDKQVVHEWNRRSTPGSAVTRFAGGESQQQPEVAWLESVERTLNAYRRNFL